MAKAAEKKDQQLIPLQEVNATTLFGSDDKEPLAKTLATINAAVKDLTFDMNKAAGRKECASVAYNVARSKTAIDEAGKTYVADLKNKAKVVDERRRFARENLDALRDTVRAPLDRWEENENARVQGHTDAITEMRQAGNDAFTYADDLGTLTSLKARVEEVNPADFEEFEENATETRLAALAKIDTSIRQAEELERERKELEQFRKEKAEREVKEAQERRKREQAEREEQIRKDAKEKAEREAEEAQKQAREKLEEEQNARKRAEEAAAEAEANAKRAAEQARQEAEERQRREAEAAAEEVRKREANTQHKGRVNRAAAEAIEAAGNVSPATAKKIVKAIVAGKVPGVKIEY